MGKSTGGRAAPEVDLREGTPLPHALLTLGSSGDGFHHGCSDDRAVASRRAPGGAVAGHREAAERRGAR